MSSEQEKLIPLHGGYRKLKSFQMAQLAYDVTVRFCDRYIEKRSRTHDQMVQATRSAITDAGEPSLITHRHFADHITGRTGCQRGFADEQSGADAA